MNEWWAQWWKDYDSQQQIFLKHYIEFMIFWVPVAALIFWGFLHLLKRKYNYAESMVVTFFITAQSMIIQCFFLLVAAIAGRTTVTRLTDGTGMALSLLLTIYLVFQLGNSELSKTRKMFMAILCAFVQFAWTLIMLNIQTEFLHKTG
jgi:hypothetical protein